jgi:hypothetical protein
MTMTGEATGEAVTGVVYASGAPTGRVATPRAAVVRRQRINEIRRIEA